MPAHNDTSVFSPLLSNAYGSKDALSLHSESSATSASDPSSVYARNRLILASLLCFLFFIIELIGGIISGSVAILSDSFHLLSDLSGFLISLFSIYVAGRKATKRHSFGFHRAEILGALLSVLVIWVVTGVLVKEAIERIQKPISINGPMMISIASAGLIVNLLLIFVLGHGHHHEHKDDEHQDHSLEHSVHNHHSHSHSHHHHHHHHHTMEENTLLVSGQPSHSHSHSHNINLRAAIIHIIGDIVSSLGVLIASIVITLKPEYSIIDPICTFFFSAIVLFTTFQLIRDSVYVLMEGTPAHIDPCSVESDLLTIPNVLAVHDLHLWTLTVGKVAMAVHLVVSEDASTNHYANVLELAQDLLCQRYHVHHTTIQVESDRSRPWEHCKSALCNGGVCAGPTYALSNTASDV